jgi:RNA polymerase sigma factor (sigma-70 family)
MAHEADTLQILLQAYVSLSHISPDESALLSNEILRLICGIVRSKLGAFSWAKNNDVCEDVVSEAVCRLFEKLQDIRSGEAPPLEKYRAYIARIAYNACNDELRRRFPKRRQAEQRLRHLLESGPTFDTWHTDTGPERVCGLAIWRDQPRAALPAGLVAEYTALGRAELADVFARCQGPVLFDELVDLAAEVWGLRDVLAANDVVAANMDNLPAQPRCAAKEIAATEIERYESYFRQVWAEIQELPLDQRRALLLNFSRKHDDAISVFVATGAASLSAIAAALVMELSEFEELWKRLPLTDREIAERLNITAQRVSNMRAAARRRLERACRARWR